MCLFASCIRKIKTIVEGKVVYKEKNAIVLSACSPLGANGKDGEFYEDKFHKFHSLKDAIT